jgi:hypothetical protein
MGKEEVVREREAIASGSTTTGQKPFGRAKGRWFIILGMWASLFLTLPWAMVAPAALAVEGEASEHFIHFLEIPLEGENIPRKILFPLYEQNNIRYFSAGLGKEERSLAYPPYPLKLIFVKGERAYLTSVAIEVLQPDGTRLLSIPEDEVQGPWLFLNLPSGKYVVKATDSSGMSIERSINVPEEKMTTVHFRWP